ncbi:MAG TPA: cyclic nucleotide-binding domain-containing protein [Caldithrix abyssi]|uniref:Cyclic nucleotide-binding domain-containing protein n=1 Tax=Caldithrix abyssi TaxID=187145 RepID=A0A7V4U2C2_CALAY|nr:cyclic nucleotide-binding domain-containing protein [Caldithrix abyssi]
MIQIGKILKQVPIFRMLGKDSINFIVERLKFKTFNADETICKIGDPGDEMYIIISGKVKICIYGEDGKTEQVVATLTSGDYFGEMALLTGETRSASVIAVEPSETFVLHKNDFDVILERFPSISLSMGKIVSQRLRETLKKASQLPAKGEKIEAAQSGPAGHLKDVPLVDLISFCESNSLTGSMTITNDGQEGKFEFESGQLQSVVLGDKRDDQALDEMLNWPDGYFQIKVRPLTLKKVQDETEEKSEQPKRILIVNNSLVVRKVVERAFRGLGYAVQTAQNIGESMKIMEKEKPDIIISDIKLPDGSGLDFLGKVREQADVAFIFITDNGIRPDFDEKLKEAGRAELTKSHEVSEIVKLVENMI